ncbi:MAG: prepilin-type N-terminal cleavage/methylation domain-containing protein [Chlamydiales bacterium]|nr:prepilin-type N-terminal cleavage/methylation domain-containing protein [Chlamydiales bacterium]
MRRLRSFTLLEVMIALSLASILLSGLMVSYYQISKKRVLAEGVKKNQLSVELMLQRLKHLFIGIESAEKPYLQTDVHPDGIGNSLFFEFDQGVDREAVFCRTLKGMLYRNLRGQICLVSWPSEEEGRVEVLLEGVDLFEFSFFDEQKKVLNTEWEKKDPLPVFMKLSWKFCSEKKGKEEMVFFFSKRGPILYDKEGM